MENEKSFNRNFEEYVVIFYVNLLHWWPEGRASRTNNYAIETEVIPHGMLASPDK